MPACENEDSTSKVQWGGGSQNSHGQNGPSEDTNCPSLISCHSAIQRTQVPSRETRTEATDSLHPDWHGFHGGPQTSSTGHMLRLFLHLTQVRPRPSWRGRSSAVCSSGNDLLFQSHPYEHHHFWASRMLYLSITIATHTTSLRAVGFILWRRKYGGELMPMKSPDYHMPHRQAHPAGCGLVLLQQAVCGAIPQESRNPAAQDAHQLTQEFCFPSCDLGLVSKRGMLPSGSSVTLCHSPDGLQDFSPGCPSPDSPPGPAPPNQQPPGRVLVRNGPRGESGPQ